MASLPQFTGLHLSAAFATGTVAAAAAGAGFVLAPTILPVALVIAALHSVLFGIPTYFFLKQRLRFTPWAAVVAGYLIAAVPITLLGAVSPPDSASIGDVVTVTGGVRTIAGWIELLTGALMFGLPGAIGGLIFWLSLKLVGATAEVEVRQQSPHRPIILLLLTFFVAVGFFQVPNLMRDRSCHNPIWPGENSINSEIGADVTVAVNGWPALAEVARSFALDRGWSLREDVRPDKGFPWFQVSMCDASGTNISLDGVFEGEVGVAVYQPQGGDSWQEPASDFLRRVETQWPGKVTFTDQSGRLTERPAWAGGAAAPTKLQPTPPPARPS